MVSIILHTDDHSTAEKVRIEGQKNVNRAYLFYAWSDEDPLNLERSHALHVKPCRLFTVPVRH